MGEKEDGKVDAFTGFLRRSVPCVFGENCISLLSIVSTMTGAKELDKWKTDAD